MEGILHSQFRTRIIARFRLLTISTGIFKVPGIRVVLMSILAELFEQYANNAGRLKSFAITASMNF